jgi:hypothetical protein
MSYELITDADAEVGRWEEFLKKSSQLPPTDMTPVVCGGHRARVYDPLEAVNATLIAITRMMKGLVINF